MAFSKTGAKSKDYYSSSSKSAGDLLKEVWADIIEDYDISYRGNKPDNKQNAQKKSNT